MEHSALLAIVERLCGAEFDVLDRDELAATVAAAARVRGWLDTVELRCTRRARSLADTGSAEPAPALISRHGARSSRDAAKIDRRDKVAAAMPTLEDDLEAGTISAGHLDAIADATRNASPEVRAAFAAHEEELRAFAATDSIDTFKRRCRSLVTQLTARLTGNDSSDLDRQRAASSVRTWVDDADGLHITLVKLDPLRHEISWNALNRSIRRRQQLDGNARTPWNQIQTDALIDAVTGNTGPVASPPAAATTPTPRPTGTTTQPNVGPNAGTQDDADEQPTTAAPRDDVSPPSPAADIARDLSDAIHRSMGVTDDPPPAADPPPAGDPPPAADPPPRGATPETTDAELRHIEQRLPEVLVVTELDVLVDGLHAHGLSETQDGIPLPASTIRRLCCDAEIIPVVLDGNEVPLDVGRSSRTVTPGQRRALRALHRTCANPDCTVPFSQTKVHHVRFWTRDTGPTDIENLLPLCERCHHLVHEGRWTLTMTPDRTTTWTRPDGTVHHHGPVHDRPPPTSSHPPPDSAAA